MAKIERVTVTCDGFCGGNAIEGDGNTFALRPQGLANRAVDLCDECAALFRATYDKGVLVKAGRPRTRRETPARAPKLTPEIVPMTSPAASPPMTVAAEPEGVVTGPSGSIEVVMDDEGPADFPRDADGWPVDEPVVEVPVGTGT